MTVKRFQSATIVDTDDTTDVAFYMSDSETLGRVFVDANFDGTQLALLASDEGDPENFVPVKDDSGTAIAIPIAAGEMVVFDTYAGPLATCYGLKFQSDANQAGADCEVRFWKK